jgi:hypothetical protein
MTFGPAVGNVGMYVAREMLSSVPEEQRQGYLRMVEEISNIKYQLGVEVARQLPRLLAEGDPDSIERYLRQVEAVATIGWKSGVEVAKQLPDLYDAPDETLAERYVEIISQASRGLDEGGEVGTLKLELEQLERQIQEMEPKVKRAQELKTHLAAHDRRDDRRRKHAVELASALPPILARLKPKHRGAYLEFVEQVAASDPEAALEAADTLLDLLNSERVSEDGAQEWVVRGLIELDKNKEVGRGYFRMGSKYSLQVLDELEEGLPLKAVARVLKLYATALAGRDVSIRAITEMAAVDAYAADHIILPPDMRAFDDDEQNFIAYKVATAHGAGRIEFGTYDLRVDELTDVQTALAQRYGSAT